jgi:MraZ protein
VRGVFTGEFELSLDDKKRLMIPRSIRDQIDPTADGTALYIALGMNRRLSIFTERQYEQLSRTLAGSLIPDVNLHNFKLMHYGLATQVTPDSVGRITLTDKQVKRAGLDREVTLVGVEDRLEIWNRADWDRHVDSALNQYDQVMDSARPAVRSRPAEFERGSGTERG